MFELDYVWRLDVSWWPFSVQSQVTINWTWSPESSRSSEQDGKMTETLKSREESYCHLWADPPWGLDILTMSWLILVGINQMVKYWIYTGNDSRSRLLHSPGTRAMKTTRYLRKSISLIPLLSTSFFSMYGVLISLEYWLHWTRRLFMVC